VTAAEPSLDHHEHQRCSELGSATEPVSGMSVDPATAQHRADHAGNDYFFCGARCRERFVAEPERFLSPAFGSMPAAGSAAGP
jgi:P-type Cu+ transporter